MSTRRHIEHVSKRTVEIAEADERTVQNQEGFVYVCSALVAYTKASATGELRKRPFDHHQWRYNFSPLSMSRLVILARMLRFRRNRW